MPKLTNTQLIMLSSAAQRADGAVQLPENLKGSAAQKAAARLLREGLVVEVPAGPDLQVWRLDQDDQAFALVITALGKQMIGITDESAMVGEPGEEEGVDQSSKAASRPSRGTPDPIAG